ncbi:hypothetical protein GLOIN_2v1883823 [Rhizophagus clarus]|uniref:F-box domain-containing protein n=1 Tax=Rhizophagus clarus TaxID=94130 RepID=A0A8H3LZK6_9GLOM|nr:hypothetical protein GLOIN_2v1883823 [Rhizophagus clarus]
MMDIYSILDQSYAECHDIIMNHLQDDVNTLYSCILVNRRFCRIFIPILWKNPFKFVKKEKNLIEIFNTLIHCLELNDKHRLITERLINIRDLPTTSKAYFKYHSFIKEFELNPLQKGMRLWISKYITKTKMNGSQSTRRVKKSVIIINQYIGKLLFNQDNQYESINIRYTDLLSGPNTLFSICDFVNHEKSLINVNKLSLSLFHRNSTDLMPIITMKILSLQNVLSPNIQHLQIFIDTTKDHSQFTYNLINFIKFQNNLKSLLISPFCKKGDLKLYFAPFLDALKNHSNSLTFLKLKFFSISINQLLPLLISLPNLITLDFDLICEGFSNDNSIISNEILNLPTSLFKKLKHLNYSHNLPSSLFKQILLSSSDNLKSLKIGDTYYPFIKDVQQLCNLNLSHFHLVITSGLRLEDLSSILENLHHLVHLKLSSTSYSYLLEQLKRISYLGNLSQLLNSNSSALFNSSVSSASSSSSTSSSSSSSSASSISSLSSTLSALSISTTSTSASTTSSASAAIPRSLLSRNRVSSADQDRYENIIKIFSRSLPPSLKILEINFLIPESYLKILLNESLFNLQSIKLHDYGNFEDNLLRIFIDYQKRKNCFKELGIKHNKFSETCMKEAKNLFKITKNTTGIDDPFYDIPIKSSSWGGH